MGESKKRDLEIVFNILWKNRPLNADDRSTLVGMYDIPSTTLNLETFKSYLLKNSGSSGEDIKISYMDYDDMEVPIESQEDFSLALYSFRKRARVGDIITLALEKVVDYRRKGAVKRVCVGSETEIPVDAKPNESALTSGVLRLIRKKAQDGPPEWFLAYMKKFKKELLEEISSTVLNVNPKSSSHSQHSSHHSRKSKVETYKRSRKYPLIIPEAMFDKDVVRHTKLERKLENKLEKLEHKTLKIKAKKLALKCSSDSDVGRSSCKASRLIGQPPVETEVLMDATAVNVQDAPVLHMIGGDVFLQKWEVVNTGKLPWTDDTELRYAWGSELLNPVGRRISCPKLNPGEKGTVSVTLDIPETPGNYECYWHFHHMGRRFGHWLGFHVIVDEPAMRVFPSPSAPPPEKPSEVSHPKHLHPKQDTQVDIGITVSKLEELSLELPQREVNTVNSFNVNVDANSSDSEVGSVVSMSNSESSALGYVMVKNEKEDEATGLLKEEENKKEEDFKVAETVDDYAYIYYKGEKYPFHKKYLQEAYLNRLEKDPKDEKPVEEAVIETQTPKQLSEKRLFMFPQSSPGFEVVQPVNLTMKKSQDEQDAFMSWHNSLVFNSYSENQNDASLEEPCQNNGLNQTFHEIPSSNTSSIFNHCGSINIDYPKSESSTQRNFERERQNSVNSIPCPYSIHEHTLAGCSAENCNVTNPDDSGSATSQTTPKRKEKPTTNTPENLINGAAILASSAMSAARSMMSMATQRGGGTWVNGRWVSDGQNEKLETALATLNEMGFVNRDLNITLLGRYNYDIEKVIFELLQ